MNRTPLYDCIVIGGGPSGIVAAITCFSGTPKTKITPNAPKVLLLEQHKIGGIAQFATLALIRKLQVNGKQFIAYLQNDLSHLPINVHEYERVIKIEAKKSYKIVHTTKDSYKARIIILAPGIFPYQEWLFKPNANILVKQPENRIEIFKHIERMKSDKPILLVGSSNIILKTKKIMQHVTPSQKIVTLITHTQPLTIKNHNDYKKILFDYYSFKLNPSTTDFIQKNTIHLQNGYINVNQSFQTNIPGILACGNIVSPISGVLQAVYSGYAVGLYARDMLKKKKSGLFPWFINPEYFL